MKILNKIWIKLSALLRRLFLIYIIKEKQAIALENFRREGGNEKRFQYLLNSESIVFDVGGYRGEWAKRIAAQYNPNLYIFEPHPKFQKIIKTNLQSIENVNIAEYGLSVCNEEKWLYTNEDASSTRIGNQTSGKILCKFKDIIDVIKDEKIQKIDLLKLNIEGDEYDLLERLIAFEKHLICKNLQIQFHKVDNNSVERWNKLRKRLSETHKLTYDYYFVWENWELLNAKNS